MIKQCYNIALIGCGSMGAAHLDDIYAREDARVQYVCDIKEERADFFARKYNAAHVATDYKKVVASDEVDIVIIATYPSSHLAILKECIAHKKHVICEKPLASHLEEAEEMDRLIRENPDVKVLIGYILRHNKTWQKMAEMIRGGAIGFPIVMRMVQNHHTMDWEKYENLIREAAPILDCGVHYIDVMRWFTGAEVLEVSGIGQRTENALPEHIYNYGLMTAKLSDGSIAYYEAGWGNTISSGNLKEFIGPCGRIRMTYEYARSENQEEGDLIEYYRYPEGTYETINIKGKRKPTGAQYRALLDMIEYDAPANPSMEDVLASYRIAKKADSIIRKTME